MKHPPIPVALTAAIAAMQVEKSHRHDAPPETGIATAFRETYVHRTFLKDDAITCTSVAGAVILSGTVAESSHRILAYETVACLPGVESIDNRLEVAPDMSTAAVRAGMAAEFADRWIARKLRLTLLFHRDVSATTTNIVVQDGIVTLSGNSTSSAQCDLTSEYAKDIDGVKGVVNDMIVTRAAPRPARSVHARLDDASITAQIRTALLIHRSTCALRAVVEVRNGDVSLTGIAANAAERTLVGKLVGGIHGVGVVRNEMTIGQPAGA